MNKIIFEPVVPKFPEVRPADIIEVKHSDGRVFSYFMVYSHNGHSRNKKDLRLLDLSSGKPWCLNGLWTELTPNRVRVLPPGTKFSILTVKSNR